MRRRLGPALLLTLTFALYVPVCHFGFVDWDDGLHVFRDPYLQPLSLTHLARFWRGAYEGEYVPLADMAFAWLCTLGRLPAPALAPGGTPTVFNPHVFHTANLVLHLLNVLLVFLLLRRVVRHEAGAFAGALLFAVHPVQVEVVAWISELRGLLSGCLSLLALHQYLSYACAGDSQEAARRAHYFGALALFVLAMLAKADAVVVPVMACLLDWGVAHRPLRRSLTVLAGWVLAALPIIAMARGAQPVPPDLHLPLWQRPLVAGDALAFYLSKLLLPVRLAVEYGRTPASVLHTGAVYVTVAAVGVLLALGVWVGRRRPRVLLALGLWVAGLLPVLGFVPFFFQTLSTVADRYLYLAMLGPALLAALLVTRDRRGLASVAVGAFLILGVCLARPQIGVWRDNRALFEHAVAVNPRSGLMRYNLGNEYVDEGRPEAAVVQYRASVRLRPRSASTHCNLGRALVDAGHPQEAVPEFQEALWLNPRLSPAHLNLGLLLADRGDLDGAISEMQTAVRLTPGNIVAHYDLGCALVRRRRPGEAAAQFQEALRRQPDFVPARQALAALTNVQGKSRG